MDKQTAAAVLPVVFEILESEDEILTILSSYPSRKRKKRTAIKNYISNVALAYSLDDFKSHFRLRRDTFEHLLGVLEPYLNENKTGVGRPMETPVKQLLVVLSMLANQEVFRTIAERYDISKSTAWCYVHNICKVLVKLANNYIKWPTGVEAIKTMTKFKERQGFENVLGVMDGSHIPITAPRKQQATYYNRNKYHSIVLQAVCNTNYMFTDVFAGYPGSVHDSRVFRNSPLAKRIEGNPAEVFPHNSYILADSAYQNTNYVLTTYKDQGHLTRIQKNYNFKHASTRVFIEQSFGLLKGRFRILKHVNIYKTELIPPLIIACCVLHNICMQRNDDIEPDLDKGIEPPIAPYPSNEPCAGLNKRNYIANMLYKKYEVFCYTSFIF